MDDGTSTLTQQLDRLKNLWPTLRKKPEVLDEITRSLTRHGKKITDEDIVAGFDQVIEQSPTSGWPPGPHEVTGCVLNAANKRRTSSRPHANEPIVNLEVADRRCSRCSGPVNLHPHERIIHCPSCNLVQVVVTSSEVPRHRLESWEVNQIPVTRIESSDNDKIEW